MYLRSDLKPWIRPQDDKNEVLHEADLAEFDRKRIKETMHDIQLDTVKPQYNVSLGT